MTPIPDQATVLMDARWLHMGGAGRATELLLKGLRDLGPSGAWIVWGPHEAENLLWPGARLLASTSSPRAFGGQRGRTELPAVDCALFMHQIRPLVSKPTSVVLIHDTIPLRTARNPAIRAARRAYLKASASLATRILTVSAYSAARIERDLGIRHSKITVVRYPVDPDFVARVNRLRQTVPASNTILYVGRFAVHKNIDRLMRAFATTSFAGSGGELVCVGGTPAEIRALLPLVPTGARITLLEACPQDQLDVLYARARLLVLPSLEEGFGLPVLEAQSIGLTACVADAGALPELVPDPDLRFDPRDEPDMAETIDLALEAGRPDPEPPSKVPPPAPFAAEICDVMGTLLDIG